ncbi:hypothetical protein BJ987_004651 [Nocardia goodfellowii]|uniref:Uncharacterized protein n=1 Tax=Nocardia goodfellowii TaxID=882446 RepID=A0ABS4QKU2_9NOCA|nr:hypothetical protein [Nocardia goodfellowii]
MTELLKTLYVTTPAPAFTSTEMRCGSTIPTVPDAIFYP